MVRRQPFQNINRCRNGPAFAVLHRLRQIELVEQHIAKLLGRIDIEFLAAAFVDFFGFGINLTF